MSYLTSFTNWHLEHGLTTANLDFILSNYVEGYLLPCKRENFDRIFHPFFCVWIDTEPTKLFEDLYHANIIDMWLTWDNDSKWFVEELGLESYHDVHFREPSADTNIYYICLIKKPTIHDY